MLGELSSQQGEPAPPPPLEFLIHKVGDGAQEFSLNPFSGYASAAATGAGPPSELLC